MHHGRDDFARCAGLRRVYGTRQLENDANDFATEVTLPSDLFVAHVGDALPTMELIQSVAARFPTCADSVAIRLLLHTRAACAAVCSVGGRVKWWARTPAFETIVPWAARIDERTAASRLHRDLAASGPMSIAAGIWERSASDRPLREAAIRLGNTDAVLSWLIQE
jgi:hypothetical protein